MASRSYDNYEERIVKKFVVTRALFVEDIGTHHNATSRLRGAGFAAQNHYLYPTAANPNRSVTIVAADGVSLELLEEAFNASVRGQELPALPETAER